MDLVLKPKILDSDHTSSTAGEEWTHWKKTMDNFIKRVETKAAAATPPETVDRLELLTNFISPSIYKYITQCATYAAAITVLTGLFIKPTNVIFSRHKLSMRKQQPGESLDDYMQALKILSKDCQFNAVTADQNSQDHIRDSFISGISSQSIRTRLLENATLTLEEAFAQTRSLDLAQKHSDIYRSVPNEATVSAVSNSVVIPPQPEPSSVIAAGTRNNFQRSTDKCFFCGGPRHPRFKCPAKDSDCKKCGKQGHWDRVCRSGKSAMASVINDFEVSTGRPRMYSISSFNSKVFTTSSVDRIPATTLADSGSNITCADRDFVMKNNFKVFKSSEIVTLASSHSAEITGYIIADLKFKGHLYRQQRISILPDLVAEVVIGTDLMELHESVHMKFGGERPPLILSSLHPIRVTAPTLFKNLTPDCEPVAVKSRQYSFRDQTFIDEEVRKLLEDGIIEPSRSPWRAQLLVHRPEHHKTRLVVDYSRTINQFTQLDAYPVPRVSDVIAETAKYTKFSSLDLQSAYHQVQLCDTDKPYTAFQAGKRLFQFKRIPFGLRNSGAVFQRILDTMVEENELQGVTIYCDNIYVGGVDQEEHDRNLKAFLDVAAKMNITFNEGKSVYSTDTISILGTQISNGIMRPDPERVKPLVELPDPKNSVELKRIIGMFAHYSQWIPKFSEYVQPLVQTV